MCLHYPDLNEHFLNKKICENKPQLGKCENSSRDRKLKPVSVITDSFQMKLIYVYEIIQVLSVTLHRNNYSTAASGCPLIFFTQS